MASQYMPFRRIDRAREPDTFPRFPQSLADPEGNLAAWLEHVMVVPLSAREWRCRRGWRVGPRVLNDTFWYWFESSGGWYRLGGDGEPRVFGAGDMLLIPQGVEHEVALHHGDGVRHLAVHFHAYLFGNVNLLSILGFPVHMPAREGAPYAGASAALAREYAIQAPGWRRAMADTIFLTLLHMIRHEGPLFQPPSGTIHRLLPRLLPALREIDMRLADPAMSVGDLARKAGMSEVYLRKLFKQVTGMGPAAFVQRRRIEQACLLLRLSGKSIKTIAAETGFNELTFFYRVFSRWTHTTPGRYRACVDDRGGPPPGLVGAGP